MEYKLITEKIKEYKFFFLLAVYKITIKDGKEIKKFLYNTTEYKSI